MNTNHTSAAVNPDGFKTRELTVMGMFVAIILIMAFTPLGIIDLPLIKATILHVPVIIGSILLGPKKGAFLGFLFGLTSFVKNVMTPSLLSFAFTPTVSVPGTEKGSLLALVICFLPRILVGVIPALVYLGINRALNSMKSNGGKFSLRAVLLAFCGFLGAFVNTALVMGMIYIFFGNAFGVAKGISGSQVVTAILGIVTANGIPEAIVAAIITPVVCLSLMNTRAFRTAK